MVVVEHTRYLPVMREQGAHSVELRLPVQLPPLLLLRPRHSALQLQQALVMLHLMLLQLLG
jgi:hypothetical protein